MMVPPVTLQLTLIPIAVSPAAVKPTAVTSVVWFGNSVTSLGVTAILVTVFDEASVVLRGRSQESTAKDTTKSAFSRASLLDSLCKNVIGLSRYVFRCVAGPNKWAASTDRYRSLAARRTLRANSR